jgi:hypothetical protein
LLSIKLDITKAGEKLCSSLLQLPDIRIKSKVIIQWIWKFEYSWSLSSLIEKNTFIWLLDFIKTDQKFSLESERIMAMEDYNITKKRICAELFDIFQTNSVKLFNMTMVLSNIIYRIWLPSAYLRMNARNL